MKTLTEETLTEETLTEETPKEKMFRNPKGYSFVYSSNHNTEGKASEKQIRGIFSPDSLTENHFNLPGIQLIQGTLQVLGKLSATVIAPYHELKLVGMIGVDDHGETDVLFCANHNASQWSVLRSGNDSIALVGHPDITGLSVSEIERDAGSNMEDFVTPLHLKVKTKTKNTDFESISCLLPNDAPEVNFGIITLNALKDRIVDGTSGTPSQAIHELLERINTLMHGISYSYLESELYFLEKKGGKGHDDLEARLWAIENDVDQLSKEL